LLPSPLGACATTLPPAIRTLTFSLCCRRAHETIDSKLGWWNARAVATSNHEEVGVEWETLAAASSPGAGGPPMLRVVLVTRVALYREGLRELLASRDEIDVFGVASNGTEACDLLRRPDLLPDVVLFDMSLAGAARDGRCLVDEFSDVPVFAIGVVSESDVIASAEMGVVGLVTAEASLDELLSSLERVARGELVCSPAVAGALLRRVRASAREGHQRSARYLLTAREQEIVALIDEGMSNKQIAQRLSVAIPTVRNHIHNILTKLGAHGRTEAAALVRGDAARLAGRA
jgi:two-component system, NarL family, nitrate/nitrite response regulator NarL